MTPENRQWRGPMKKKMHWPKPGATSSWAGTAERTATLALDTRKKVYAAVRHAATFHDGVEELVDIEEVSEEIQTYTQVALQLQGSGVAQASHGLSSGR